MRVCVRACVCVRVCVCLCACVFLCVYGRNLDCLRYAHMASHALCTLCKTSFNLETALLKVCLCASLSGTQTVTCGSVGVHIKPFPATPAHVRAIAGAGGARFGITVRAGAFVPYTDKHGHWIPDTRPRQIT